MQDIGNCKIIKFMPDKEINSELENFAEEFFEVVEINYTDDGQEQLVGYTRVETSEKTMEDAAARYNVQLPVYETEILEARDWLAENVIKFEPVYVGDFCIYGIHETAVDTKGKIGIKVYAATAFGSEHQTTKGCLQALTDINEQCGEQQKVLDVGTGSGILALAAAKLWKNAEITAVDIDDESVKVARQNAADNGVEKQIKTAYSNGYEAEIVKQNAPYDVILANILARPLIEMAEDMAKCLKNGGYAVISGFIDEQVEWVINAHEIQGLKLQKIYSFDRWRAALLKKEA